MQRKGQKMIAVEMEPSTVKPFMNRILREEIMDNFETRAVEMTITTRISINGAIEPPSQAIAGATMEAANIHPEANQPSQQSPGVLSEALSESKPQHQGYISWEALRPLIFSIIKTGAKPKQIKVVFSYKAAEITTIHPNAAALFLNMTYENDQVYFTTATAQKNFALDKSLDDNWDGWVRNFFNLNGIPVTDRE